MSAPRTRKRLMDMLRRTAGLDHPSPTPGLADAELWECEERASAALSEAERLSERLAATGARQKPQLDASLERLREVATRLEAAAVDTRRARQVYERLDVVALNAALEASRAEPGNKPLAVLAEDVRAQAASGLKALNETEAMLRTLETSVSDAASSVTGGIKDGGELAADSEKLKVSTRDAQAALGELETRLRRATGLDPETARLMNAAGEHARGLAASLSSLDGPKGVEALRALGPLLSPLAKLLTEIDAPPQSGPGE